MINATKRQFNDEFKVPGLMAQERRLKLHFHFCTDIPKNDYPSKNNSANEVEIRFDKGFLSSSKARSSDDPYDP